MKCTTLREFLWKHQRILISTGNSRWFGFSYARLGGIGEGIGPSAIRVLPDGGIGDGIGPSTTLGGIGEGIGPSATSTARCCEARKDGELTGIAKESRIKLAASTTTRV